MDQENYLISWEEKNLNPQSEENRERKREMHTQRKLSLASKERKVLESS